MLLERSLAQIMVKVLPNIYQKYVIISSKGEPLLYIQKQKALYGLLHSTLLFYRKFETDLESYGSQINL